VLWRVYKAVFFKNKKAQIVWSPRAATFGLCVEQSSTIENNTRFNERVLAWSVVISQDQFAGSELATALDADVDLDSIELHSFVR